jgi:hypothetical protein
VPTQRGGENTLTEADWLDATELAPVLEAVVGTATDRQLRLLARGVEGRAKQGISPRRVRHARVCFPCRFFTNDEAARVAKLRRSTQPVPPAACRACLTPAPPV